MRTNQIKVIYSKLLMQRKASSKYNPYINQLTEIEIKTTSRTW